MKTLDGGPITVYDGGAYAGEALVETVKAGDKRLIGYAVDYGTRISTAFDTGHKVVREIHVKDGNLEIHYGERTTRTYTIRNVDARPKSLIIQQDGIYEYSVLAPKPSERTATSYRFEVKLPANGAQSLKVEEERTYLNSTAVLTSTPDFLFALVQNKDLSEAARNQLKRIADLKSTVAVTEASIKLAKDQTDDLTQDQSRLRADIDSLNRVKGQEDQVRKYSVQLAGNEVELAKIRDHRHELDLRKADLDAQVRKALDSLQF